MGNIPDNQNGPWGAEQSFWSKEDVSVVEEHQAEVHLKELDRCVHEWASSCHCKTTGFERSLWLGNVSKDWKKSNATSTSKKGKEVDLGSTGQLASPWPLGRW